MPGGVWFDLNFSHFVFRFRLLGIYFGVIILLIVNLSFLVYLYMIFNLFFSVYSNYKLNTSSIPSINIPSIQRFPIFQVQIFPTFQVLTVPIFQVQKFLTFLPLQRGGPKNQRRRDRRWSRHATVPFSVFFFRSVVGCGPGRWRYSFRCFYGGGRPRPNEPGDLLTHLWDFLTHLWDLLSHLWDLLSHLWDLLSHFWCSFDTLVLLVLCKTSNLWALEIWWISK